MKTFEVRVDVNKDGQEVYRVRAESVVDAVRLAHEQEENLDDEPFKLIREEGMSYLTINWSDVTERDVKEVDEPLAEIISPNEPAWTDTAPTEPGWYAWRPTSDAGAPSQCVWVVSIDASGHPVCWLIGVTEPFPLRTGQWCGPIEFSI